MMGHNMPPLAERLEIDHAELAARAKEAAALVPDELAPIASEEDAGGYAETAKTLKDYTGTTSLVTIIPPANAQNVTQIQYELTGGTLFYRRTIGDAFARFIRLPQVIVEDDARVGRILELYATGLDFADALHLVAARTSASSFASFDAPLARRAAMCSAKPPVVAP